VSANWLLCKIALLTVRRPDKVGLSAFLSSMKRVNKAISELKASNLKSNQQAVTDLSHLLKSGSQQLEAVFQEILQEDARPVEPLHYITKDKPFPMLDQDKTTRLGLINSFLTAGARQSDREVQETPTAQIYASVRGPYITGTLSNLAAASISTAKKKIPDAVYRQGTNGMGTYATGISGAFLAEYDNICALFSRDEWARVFSMTCRSAIAELAKTLRELDTHIKANLTTDCYLAYEIIEIISNLSSQIDGRTGELKPLFASALKPIRDTGKSSLAELLDDTRRRASNLQALPNDGAAIPLTTEIMTRLQTMVDFLRPISSIMISLGDGNWKNPNQAAGSQDLIPTLKSFDVGADGKDLFAHYSTDTIDALMTTLDQKGRVLIKGKSLLGVFLANNAAVIERMIRNSDLQPLLASRMASVDSWRKKALQLYSMGWNEPSRSLMDVQYTNRGGRPNSGSASALDSAAIVKALSSKDKEGIKEKFRTFNTSFDDLIAKHKAMSPAMEREVKEMLGREVQQMIEALYGRFWDRYHEVDKGKGKYVKYDKSSMSSVLMALL
jgi:exocyst complex protein 7